jgi:hypothetical protein
MKKAILLTILMLGLFGCGGKKQVEEVDLDLPFPADSDLVYYQAQCDSGLQQFWGDIKTISSAFISNSQYFDRGVRFEDIRIVNEGLFTGYMEINMGKTRLELKLIRKNQALGKKCIWQVVAAKESPWPK